MRFGTKSPASKMRCLSVKDTENFRAFARAKSRSASDLRGRERQNAGGNSQAVAPRRAAVERSNLPRRASGVESPPKLLRSRGDTSFLDCFPREQLAAVINSLGKAARPGACWLVSDFQIPEAGLKRLRGRMIHWLSMRFPRRDEASASRWFPSTLFGKERLCAGPACRIRLGPALRRVVEAGITRHARRSRGRRALFRGGAARTALSQALLMRL